MTTCLPRFPAGVVGMGGEGGGGGDPPTNKNVIKRCA